MPPARFFFGGGKLSPRYPTNPDRVVDVCSVGRRVKTVHGALLELVDRDRIFYVYDTLQTGESQASDHREHRDLYANTAKRSRFFVVAPSKVDVPEETRGQVEVAFRYYEGAAAGTVMVGHAPDCAPFRQMFEEALQIQGQPSTNPRSRMCRRPPRLLFRGPVRRQSLSVLGRRYVASAARGRSASRRDGG